MTTWTRTRTRTITATFASVVASVAAVLGLGGLSAQAATTYGCPLSGSTVCTSPLAGTVHGDVTVTGDGYGFNLSGNGTPGYVAVDNSNQISMGSFPVSFSAQVKGVGVPSSQVGDYDVVRGTPNGNWKLEVVARNSRTTARASCFFKGPSGKGAATGGPDLTTLQAVWTTITCTNTGAAIELRVNGTLVKTETVATGPIPNPGPLLLGAKNTAGGDQFSGSAKDVQVSVP